MRKQDLKETRDALHPEYLRIWLRQASSFGPFTECKADDEGARCFVEAVSGIANKAAEEGDLPELPKEKFCAWLQNERPVNAFPHPVGDKKKWDGDDGYWSNLGYRRAPLFLDSQMRAYARQAIAADRAARAGASENARDEVRASLQYIHDAFKRDLDAGYKTRDKEFAVEIAAEALAAPSAPVGAVLDKLLDDLYLADPLKGDEILKAKKAIDQHVASQVRAARGAQRPTDDHLWDETIRDRDTYHEWADKLAEAISKHFGAYIGEHSNTNCPWAEALEAIESAPAISHSGEGAAKAEPVPAESIECWSHNQEDFNAQSLGELIDTHELQPGATVWVGEAVHPEPKSLFSTDWLIENMGEAAYDIAGEHGGEDYPNVSDEQVAELEALVVGWIEKCAPPNFWTVKNVRPYVLTVEDCSTQELALRSNQEKGE